MNSCHRTIALATAVGALLVIAGCDSPAVVPTTYENYNANDGTFRIDYPAGWQAEGGGKGAYAWAKFTSGGATISVTTSLTGSLYGDQAQSRAPFAMPQQLDETRVPVAEVHTREKGAFEEEAGVKEQDPVVITTGLGAARKAEHRGSRTFGAPIHGYRATALGLNYRLRVVCQCSDSQWESLKPVFDKVIGSLSPGRPR